MLVHVPHRFAHSCIALQPGAPLSQGAGRSHEHHATSGRTATCEQPAGLEMSLPRSNGTSRPNEPHRSARPSTTPAGVTSLHLHHTCHCSIRRCSTRAVLGSGFPLSCHAPLERRFIHASLPRIPPKLPASPHTATPDTHARARCMTVPGVRLGALPNPRTVLAARGTPPHPIRAHTSP